MRLERLITSLTARFHEPWAALLPELWLDTPWAL